MRERPTSAAGDGSGGNWRSGDERKIRGDDPRKGAGGRGESRWRWQWRLAARVREMGGPVLMGRLDPTQS
ncbi:hypothetical protein NL676_039857 [Syzygium grande]|nr:hypothetical protein NL676_039857 [Syzygium grande]